MQKNKGFSLAELSITLIVIGLIVAAIASGTHLMQAAKINQIIAEVSGYAEAIEDFKLRYKAYPGDMPNAEDFWGTYHITDNPNGTVNGDGNERVDSAAESFRAWQQLVLSKSIAGHYTGLDNGTPDWQRGVNAPSSSVDSAYYVIRSDTDIYDVAGNILQLSRTNSNAFGAAITPADAYLVDKKIDGADDVSGASNGDIVAIRGSEFLLTDDACTDDVLTASSANYVLTDEALSCRLVYWINQE